MSEVNRKNFPGALNDTEPGDFEETRDESGSDEGSCNDHDVGIETDDFVWEDVLEEICRFENFCVDMTFTRKSCFHSLSL